MPNHSDLREELAFGAVWNRPGLIETMIQTGPYSGRAPALNALAALSEALR